MSENQVIEVVLFLALFLLPFLFINPRDFWEWFVDSVEAMGLTLIGWGEWYRDLVRRTK